MAAAMISYSSIGTANKSLLHSIIMTGSRPMYFVPSRNHYEYRSDQSQTSFRRQYREANQANPFARKDDSLRIAVVTNSTNDGSATTPR